MPTDLEHMLKELFGEQMNRFSQLKSDQMTRLNTKLQELAREALKDELGKLHTEIGELRARVTRLEEERAENASESLESNF